MTRQVATVTRPAAPLRAPRAFRAGDAGEAALIGLCRLVSATLPVSRWPTVAAAAARIEVGRRSRYRRFDERVRAVFGEDMTGADVLDLWRRYRTQLHHRRLIVVAEGLGGRGYAPAVTLRGREHLEAALARGKGAILWFDNFIHHPLIGKRPFAEHGFSAWQLSSFDHGFSRTRFGRRWLNPLQLDAEARYVAGRIAFDRSSVLAATRRVIEVLAGNGIVRVTNNAYIGRQFLDVPFANGTAIRLAVTPFNFALKAGAALLPVSVIERTPFVDYEVTVAAPLVLAGGKQAATAVAALAYAGYLEPLVRAHPEQWRGWEGLIVGKVGPDGGG